MPVYDPYSRPFQEDPYPLYRALRDETPCAYNEKMDFYALFRFEDVWQATLDWQTYSSSLGPILDNRGQIDGALFSIIGMDPPGHTRLRNLVSRGFTPRRIGALEGEVRKIAARHLGALAGRREFDLQQEFSVRFPMDVISALLGIPESDRDMYRAMVDAGLARDPDTGLQPEGNIALLGSSGDYLLDLVKQRRREPREDLITVIAEAELDEPGGRRPLTDGEVTSFCTLLAGAGAETTAKLLGNAIVFLARDPALRDELWGDPSLLGPAIEELLRYDAPSQFQGRVALRDVTVHGVPIPKGARVALVTGAACRDEREFPDPDRLDVRRAPARQIYFGHGQHFCIGKSLARLEARIALEEIRDRFPRYAVDEAGLTRTYQAHVRGFQNVPVRV